MQISHLKYSIFKINSAVPFYVLEQIRIKDKIRHPVIREVVTMQGEIYVNIVNIALIFALASGERTECRWSAEYLCGDKCLKVANSCYCGNEIIKFDDAQNLSCCQHIIGELHAMKHANNMPNMETQPYLVMIKSNV